MPTIDEQVEELLKKCQLLTDSSFTERYPGIENVTSYLDSVGGVMLRVNIKFEAYERIGANNTQEFIELLNRKDEKAIKLYENIKRIFRF